MTRPLVGILAGMGPRSTAPFIDLVVTECQRAYGAKHDDDFPPMMIYSLPTPFRVDEPLDHSAMRVAIAAGLLRLAETGAAFVAIPCNTAHIYYEQLAADAPVPILNMVQETRTALSKAHGPVALVATQHTVVADLYQPAITAAGHDLIWVSRQQEEVNEMITAVKESRADDARRMWHALSGRLADAKTILLACTELSTVVTGANVIDASRCLAEAVVRQWLEMRDEPRS